MTFSDWFDTATASIAEANHNLAVFSPLHGEARAAAIAPLRCTQCGQNNFRQQISTFQTIHELLLFEAYLRAVLEMLQGAAATAREMFAGRIDATRRCRDHIEHMGFIVIALLIVTAKLNGFTG